MLCLCEYVVTYVMLYACWVQANERDLRSSTSTAREVWAVEGGGEEMETLLLWTKQENSSD